MSYDTETGTFQEYIDGERRRLDEERRVQMEYRDQCDRAIAAIDREFDAINAYERAKTGKTAQPQRSVTRRARKGSRREELLTLIGGATDGLSRGDILERLSLKGDKSGEMSISNALTALTKSAQVERHNGRYYVSNRRDEIYSAAQALHEAAE